MTRNELIRRLDEIRDYNAGKKTKAVEHSLAALLADINEDGVLDVQCPPQIAEDMDLPRPVRGFYT